MKWYQKEKEEMRTGNKTEILAGGNKGSCIGELLKKEVQLKLNLQGEYSYQIYYIWKK